MAKEVSFLIKIHSDGGAKRVTADAVEMGRVIREVQDEAEKAKRDVLTWAEAAQAVEVLENSVNRLQAVLTEMTADYQVSVVAQTQLVTIMRQRMGATDAEIQSIRELCSAQQELGVVEDDIAASGAQQMATFLKQKQSLDVLIPAMNNLIAQQDGLNATVQGAVSIGNMMGKAMQGQTEVLQRVGITFDDAQKQVLQYGTETERAAMLAEVITANVGHMNEELGKTDAGKQKQLENTLGDIKEQVGAVVQGAMPFVTLTAQIMICGAGIAKLIAALTALNAAFSISVAKAVVLSIHEKAVAVAQNLLAASGYTAATGTTALTVAVTALYAALSMGISLVIAGLITLFNSMGDDAEDAAQDVDILKESTDAFSNASANAKAEIDMEVSSLASLINSHKSTSKKVDELNRKYGESFGYHRTAAEWYDTLIAKSKVYCAQMGYEAQAKVLASQIAAKQLEKEGKQSELYQLGQQYWDGNGKTHYNWENAAGGKDYYDQLSGEVTKLTGDIAVLQRQYDSCINHMIEAQKELDRSRTSVRVTNDNIRDLTTDEVKRQLEQKQKELDSLKGSDAAERQRLNREIGRLGKELSRRDDVNKREQGVEPGVTTTRQVAGTPKNVPDSPIADPRTLEDIGKNITYYENRLKQTDKADKEKMASLTALIDKYKELQNAIREEAAAAGRTSKLDTLEAIDAELLHQQQLRKQSSKENIAHVDAEIKRLNDLRTAFEDSSHAALNIDEIKTYEQLDSEIAFYEKQLKQAGETERVVIQKHILDLQKLRGEWDAVLTAVGKPADIGMLNSMEELEGAIGYYGDLQRKASGDEVEHIQRTINALQAKRDALTRMTQLPQLQQEVKEMDSMSGSKLRMELELLGMDGIREKIRSLQKMLDDVRNPLGRRQREEVQGLIGAWKRYEKVLRKSDADLRDAWGGVKGIGGGVESLTDALEGNGDAWQTVTGVVDGFIQIYDGVSSIISIIDALTGATAASNAVVVASGVATETATAAKIAAVPEEVAAATASTMAAKAQAMAYRELAASKFMAAHADIPFAGAGIAAGFIATMQGLVASVAVTPFANGGLIYGPTLALMGEYGGASHNPEVVAPLDKLKSIIGGGQGVLGGMFELKVKGRELVAVIANETRINRKKTNIRL